MSFSVIVNIILESFLKFCKSFPDNNLNKIVLTNKNIVMNKIKDCCRGTWTGEWDLIKGGGPWSVVDGGRQSTERQEKNYTWTPKNPMDKKRRGSNILSL